MHTCDTAMLRLGRFAFKSIHHYAICMCLTNTSSCTELFLCLRDKTYAQRDMTSSVMGLGFEAVCMSVRCVLGLNVCVCKECKVCWHCMFVSMFECVVVPEHV